MSFFLSDDARLLGPFVAPCGTDTTGRNLKDLLDEPEASSDSRGRAWENLLAALVPRVPVVLIVSFFRFIARLNWVIGTFLLWKYVSSKVGARRRNRSVSFTGFSALG